MKKIIIIPILLINSFVFSQKQIQKYNEVLKRYEYYDESGNLLAYKKYNPVLNQWETYSNNSQSSTDRKPFEYADPVSLDISNTLGKAASILQERYDKRKANNVIILAEPSNEDIANKKKYLDYVDSMKNTVASNMLIINNIISDKKFNKSYEPFFNEIMPQVYNSLKQNDYELVRWAYLTTNTVVENYKKDNNWFH